MYAKKIDVRVRVLFVSPTHAFVRVMFVCVSYSYYMPYRANS